MAEGNIDAKTRTLIEYNPPNFPIKEELLMLAFDLLVRFSLVPFPLLFFFTN